MTKQSNTKTEWTTRSFVPTIEGDVITGTPIVFNQTTDIAGLFSEEILPTAINESALRDAAFFINHKLDTMPITRVRTGKLKFEIQSDGVHMHTTPNRERSDVNDLYIAIQDGDMDGMSFMMVISDEEWLNRDSDYPHRIIKAISYVREVSAVTYPAYSGTNINARAELELDSAKHILENMRATSLDNDETRGNEVKKLALAKAKARAKSYSSIGGK